MTDQESTKNENWKDYDGTTAVRMVHGFELLLMPNCEYSRKRFVYRVAESNEIDWLLENKKSFFKDSTCVDVGANIGYWTKLLVEKLEARQVHSFEPVPETYRILERNLSDHKPPRVHLNKAVVGTTKCSSYMYVDPSHSGDARPQFTPGRTKIATRSISLDDYIFEKNIASLNFVKIDVQGGEIDVLKSARKTLTTLKPLLMIEIDPDLNKDISTYLNEIISLNNANAFVIRERAICSAPEELIGNYKGNLFIQF